MNKDVFPRSLIESLLFHVGILLLLLIIPFSENIVTKDFLEVSLYEGQLKFPSALRKQTKSHDIKTVISPLPKIEKSPLQKKVNIQEPISKSKPEEIIAQKTRNTSKQTPSQKTEATGNKQIKTGNTDQANIQQGTGGSNNISGPLAVRKIVFHVQPEYPAWARQQGIETELRLKLWVNPKGEVTKVIATQRSGYTELDLIAKQALRQWIFAPLPENVEQEVQTGTVPVRFQLD